jgi:hypothetical protein
METEIMSKTNDTSSLGRKLTELKDSELDTISGGFEAHEHATIGCASCEAAAVAALNALGRISGGR